MLDCILERLPDAVRISFVSNLNEISNTSNKTGELFPPHIGRRKTNSTFILLENRVRHHAHTNVMTVRFGLLFSIIVVGN